MKTLIAKVPEELHQEVVDETVDKIHKAYWKFQLKELHKAGMVS